MTTPEPRKPLEVPQRALEVDLPQAFGQLLFRASMLQRRRAEEAQAAKAAQRELIAALVEVDDALASLGLDRELVLLGRGGGIEATRRRLLGKLAKAGVRPMRLDGLAADPALTEIVGSEPRRGVEPETVVETVVTGFFWGDEVLRRAQVVVAAHVPAPAEHVPWEPGPGSGQGPAAGTGAGTGVDADDDTVYVPQPAAGTAGADPLADPRVAGPAGPAGPAAATGAAAVEPPAAERTSPEPPAAPEQARRTRTGSTRGGPAANRRKRKKR
ncbi:nucleotide exchange factor GrpE [Streptomyces sp. BE303]|uniref:nucleotide exchange factor GrpE n=1 Tax=Streptomyces sp. BE303 TaxID=3002528 RepID=UPI002E7A2C5E|nr:nucleotide exchange factor GrpE [Streptomyces sp. BE303]MED7948125.1 nucleotide exchange factor GrpE [Streptomyces sp. BE303]